ncbi:protein FAM166A [Dermochelys coriacea]|uniref:protein FAM166A n=1 Tax=Dermochelys coriacea TaxID=27794 RepID=UPI001CA8E99C|nr:protein FAM166A [Dermochelys coriacea]
MAMDEGIRLLVAGQQHQGTAMQGQQQLTQALQMQLMENLQWQQEVQFVVQQWWQEIHSNQQEWIQRQSGHTTPKNPVCDGTGERNSAWQGPYAQRMAGASGFRYGGFYPQIHYQIGETYGKTTSRLLTDYSVPKSSCSVLAPLVKPRFIEDFSGTKHPSNQMLDQNYSYFPRYTGRGAARGLRVLPLPTGAAPAAPIGQSVGSHTEPGFIPYQNAQFGPCCPTPATESRAPLLMVLPAQGQQSWVDTDTGDSMQLREQRKYIPCHPGIRLACGHGWKSSSSPTGTPLASEQEERKAPCYPDIALACGQGWRSSPCPRGTKQPVRIEGVPLDAVIETVDVSRYNQLPKLDVPNLIQRKAISGYTGCIPRFTWIMGVNYLQGVKDAMNEFDRNQRAPVAGAAGGSGSPGPGARMPGPALCGRCRDWPDPAPARPTDSLQLRR